VSTVNQTTHWLLGQRLPTEIGSYVVERRLVSGPSYADYAARHLTLGHDVLFRHEHWSSDLAMRDALEGLRRARRLQAEIQHPHILPVFDFFEHRGEWFSVFPRVPEARSLHEIISAIAKEQRPPFTISEFVAVSAGVTAGLAAIHRAGFVHRTLGIHNVLVDARDHVLLTDLGCATPVGADDAAAAAFRQFMRPASAAPEQFTATGAFSTAFDAWALGVALFELRYGGHPFWARSPETFEAMAFAILTAEVRFPAAADDEAERLLQQWLGRLLERDPEKRYADALEAQRDLLALAAETQGRAPLARAFVAMPFAEGFDGLWRAIRSACAACRIAATRADQSHAHDNIWDDVCAAIRSTDFTIAVATPDATRIPNPNVMLEVGYARALGKPVLLLTDAPDTLPFDLRTQRALLYRPELVAGGAFHRELVTFLTGLVARRVGGALSD
jgi:nucleoside 2-deoxyribosyltransferase